MLGYEHTFTHTVRDLVLAIDSQELPTPNFEDGVRLQGLLDAIERSSASRAWQKVETPGDLG
jgi:predicted dehydrogenase